MRDIRVSVADKTESQIRTLCVRHGLSRDTIIRKAIALLTSASDAERAGGYVMIREAGSKVPTIFRMPK